jgi:hypothetical protein
MNKYLQNTPSFFKILSIFDKTRFLGFDHIATRTFNPLNYHNFLIKNNYYKMNDKFSFPHYNAVATWYKSNKQQIPRVFLSSYQSPIYDKNIDIEKINYFINNPNKITFQDYKNIQKQNQYLAWTLLFKNDINHLALQLTNIEQLIEDLSKNNFQLNDKTNPIKISPDGGLKQTSLMADLIEYKFKDGIRKVPYGFVEFVERTRDGFEESNAKDIFKSTGN